MNTLNKRQEQRQVQQQKASEIWDKQTDSKSQRGRSHKICISHTGNRTRAAWVKTTNSDH